MLKMCGKIAWWTSLVGIIASWTALGRRINWRCTQHQNTFYPEHGATHLTAPTNDRHHAMERGGICARIVFFVVYLTSWLSVFRKLCSGKCPWNFWAVRCSQSWVSCLMENIPHSQRQFSETRSQSQE